jgi:hypothetical protein
MFSPRPPVVYTNRFYGSNEFRFYVDLNRDGVFTRTGLLIVTNQNGQFYTTDGGVIPPAMPPPVNTLSNWFNGDPQFIGQLERPELPHSSSNKFVARYAFIVLPAGKTLDVNYIGNHAKPNPPLAEGFYRNMGVGSWENNFAAFLRDLTGPILIWPARVWCSTMHGRLRCIARVATGTRCCPVLPCRPCSAPPA